MAPRNPEWYPVSRGDIQSVYFDRHHYIHNEDGQEEVYDLDNDLMEAIDLIDSSAGQEVAKDCRRFMDEYLSQIDIPKQWRSRQ
jgi:hypothetical protein